MTDVKPRGLANELWHVFARSDVAEVSVDLFDVY